MLTSDELGEKGESRFKEICADAHLICNKSDRDRTGWDFLVEFPFDGIPLATLDGRPTPISCHVQVKTVRGDAHGIRLRLSAAERLAKEVKPAFVYILTVGENLEITGAYLIHLLDDRLSVILKRLRKEQAKGKHKSINKQEITIKPRSAEALAPTGIALRQAIARRCSTGMHAYAHDKKFQLETLGFSHDSVRGKMAFDVTREDEVLDALLGIKKNLPVSLFETSTTRFGITLDGISTDRGTVTMTPLPAGECTMTIRENRLATPAVFSAPLFVASIPTNKGVKAKAIFKAKLFSLSVNFIPGEISSYNLSYDLANSPGQSFPEWKNFWTMMRIYSLGEGKLELRLNDRNDAAEFPIFPNSISPSTDYCNLWISYCEQAEQVLRQAGHPSPPKITYANLVACHNQVGLLFSMLNCKKCELAFTTNQIEADLNKMRSIIVARVLTLGDARIAYYGTGHFSTNKEGGEIKWRSLDFALRRIESINDTDEAFDDFVRSAQDTEQLMDIIRIDETPMASPMG